VSQTIVAIFDLFLLGVRGRFYGYGTILALTLNWHDSCATATWHTSCRCKQLLQLRVSNFYCQLFLPTFIANFYCQLLLQTVFANQNCQL
jgi:hypothetical protein